MKNPFSGPFAKIKSIHWKSKKSSVPNPPKKKKKRRLRLGEIVILILVGYVVVSFWPLRELLLNGFLNGRTLVVFTNEAEARPCGGFVTAVGEVQLFPPVIRFRNAYEVTADLGESTFPLNKVSQKMNFWDLGTSADLAVCAEDLRKAYQSYRDKKIDHVILFDVKTAEDIFVLFGEMKLNGKDLDAKTLFSTLSRMVADVDRHSEEALAQRKAPLSRLGKKMIWRALFNPTILPQLTRIVERSFQSGQIFSPEISPQIRPERNDFVVTEWNLGGGKSSRYLQKTLNIIAREVRPNDWGIFVELTAQHAGGTDEPLSQDWKGVFEVRAPKFLGVEPFFAEAEIKPGRAFRKQFMFEYEGEISEFSIFRPRGQELFANVSVSLFPQKMFHKATFQTHENTGVFLGEVTPPRRTFRWITKEDNVAPFVTLHEVISVDQLSIDQRVKWNDLWKDEERSFLTVEVHLNEMIQRTEEFSAVLRDLNIGARSHKENPELITADLLSNNTTLLLGFIQTERQDQERFELTISGLEDFHGNTITPAPRTVIDRRISVP
jgi:hypothetical protein